jgi:HAD superfamily hydrolase (TIGR01549 family)
MAPLGIKAVIFDLYDTLVRIRKRRLHKAAPRLLGASASRWVELIREDLLTRPFDDRGAFVRFLCQRLGARDGAEQGLLALLDEELASVEACEGAVPLLAFLRRRGYAIGLLSNASSVHKEPFFRLGLARLFDAVSFSCDAGVGKPEASLYLDLCARLRAEPGETLFVGDSLPNDVMAPRALGMRALRVGGTRGEGPGTTFLLGFMSLQPDSELQPLLADGDRVSLGGRAGTLHGLRPLADSEQGRYNLVAVASVELDSGETETVYCKRYLLPEGAYVEDFAYRFLAALGVPSCHAVLSDGPEPCLVVSSAPGTKLEEATTAPVAREVGRHAALAYLFANADLRPRNAFVSEAGGNPSITMTDLEHCFLNLALDVSGIADPLRPESLDRLSDSELSARIVRRVLTPRTMKRARRAFLGTDDPPAALRQAFRDGWMSAYRTIQQRAEEACQMLEERIRREPFLVIGMQAHRRAMARVDLEDIRGRLREDAGVVYAASFGA